MEPEQSSATDVSMLQHLYKVFYNDLNICGCGSPEEATRLVFHLMNLMPLHEDSRWMTAQDLCGNEGSFHLILSTLEAAGLIEHGSSISRAWATDKGKWLLWATWRVGLDCLEDAIELVGLPHYGGDCSAACWSTPSTVTNSEQSMSKDDFDDDITPIHIAWVCPVDGCDCVLPAQVVGITDWDIEDAEDLRWSWYLEHAKQAHTFEDVFMSLRGTLDD